MVARWGSTPTDFQKLENYARRYSLLKNNGPVTSYLLQNGRGSLQLIPCPLANTLLLEEPSPDKLFFMDIYGQKYGYDRELNQAVALQRQHTLPYGRARLKKHECYISNRSRFTVEK